MGHQLEHNTNQSNCGFIAWLLALAHFSLVLFYLIKVIGYALGIYSPISLVLMSIYHKNGTDWSPDNKEPLNTLVNTTLYIGAFAGSALSPLFVNLPF